MSLAGGERMSRLNMTQVNPDFISSLPVSKEARGSKERELSLSLERKRDWHRQVEIALGVKRKFNQGYQALSSRVEVRRRHELTSLTYSVLKAYSKKRVQEKRYA